MGVELENTYKWVLMAGYQDILGKEGGGDGQDFMADLMSTRSREVIVRANKLH